MDHDVLYLGSESASRQKLLNLLGVNFRILSHKSSECMIELSDDFERCVISIASDKMKHLALIGTDVKESRIFVLTADTLARTVRSNQILGKPKDFEDAKRILRIIRDEPVTVLTGCCLQVMCKNGQYWNIENQICWATGAELEFCVDEESLNLYLKREPEALKACGASIIEGYGQVFLKKIKGSYSAVLGLPLFELRQKLKELNFRF